MAIAVIATNDEDAALLVDALSRTTDTVEFAPDGDPCIFVIFVAADPGSVHLLAGPSVTLGLGKRKAKLPSTATKRLDELAKLITDAKTVTCLAYSDKGKGDVRFTL